MRCGNAHEEIRAEGELVVCESDKMSRHGGAIVVYHGELSLKGAIGA